MGLAMDLIMTGRVAQRWQDALRLLAPARGCLQQIRESNITQNTGAHEKDGIRETYATKVAPRCTTKSILQPLLDPRPAVTLLGSAFSPAIRTTARCALRAKFRPETAIRFYGVSILNLLQV